MHSSSMYLGDEILASDATRYIGEFAPSARTGAGRSPSPAGPIWSSAAFRRLRLAPIGSASARTPISRTSSLAPLPESR